MTRYLFLLVMCLAAMGVAFHSVRARATVVPTPYVESFATQRPVHRPYRYDDGRQAPAEAVSARHRGSL